ncbi:MAG: hypothetical protein FK734_05385 [Asgard group archaeon]|nr:hypothetical protein [Asgard group archaeon]
MVKQSDSNKLLENIAKLKERKRGKYTFFWAHPIKLPKTVLENNVVMFWDRRNDQWIIINDVKVFPKINQFDQKNIQLLPEEDDYYLLIGSFNVILKRIQGKWSINIEIIV